MNQGNITAVLIETVSIQTYIFSSNKLKENIGASYIIENLLYKKTMIDVIKKLPTIKFSELWIDEPDSIAIEKNGFNCEIGYIGGGNALVLFNNNDLATSFIKNFSKECLISFPALRLAFGIKSSFDFGNYKTEFELLLTNLKENKSKFIPLVSIPKHGITADCPFSNESAEVLDKKSNKFISFSSEVKIKKAEESQRDLKCHYKALGEEYTFTDEVDNLGQSKEASYIAVVHIDGNGMGKVFAEINKLCDLRKKSIAVSSKAKEAMNLLINHVIDLQTNEEKKLKELQLHTKDQKTILPFRPILVGGDDITFICEGRLGLYMAEKFQNK